MSSRIIEERLVGGGFVSGARMAQEASVSRTAIFKHIERLRRMGYSIESQKAKGYRLVPRPDGLLPLEVRARLASRVFGGEVHSLEKTDSTQNHLRRIADSGGEEGTVVIALEQSSGKGRLGREWLSPRGGLWFSLLLRPRLAPTEMHKLTLLFGLAVANSIAPLGVDPRLRWPNDVLVLGKKVCGILMEASSEMERINYVLVGIGVNANFSSTLLGDSLSPRSATLMDLLGQRVDRALLIASILEEAEGLYLEASSHGFGRILKAWKEKSSTIGSRVTVTESGRSVTGIAEGLDESGFLVIRTPSGASLAVSSGDIRTEG